MPKCLKIYPNCIWHVPSEWHGLNFSAKFTGIMLLILSVSVSPLNLLLTLIFPLHKKSNLQVHFGSKAMASLYDLLCYHSLTSTDPLLEELLSYLPTRFHSHIFDYIAYEHSSDEESIHSIDSSVSAFYSDDSTYFS